MQPGPEGAVRIAIRCERDVVKAVLEAGALCDAAGMRTDLKSRFATSVSELSRNIVKYANSGEVYLRAVDRAGRRGLQVTAQDRGPGIEDTDRALRDNYSSSGTLGLGLPGVKRLMDEFDLQTERGGGTRVVAVLWI
jgi:serine/threonine-protein kinase RsbT